MLLAAVDAPVTRFALPAGHGRRESGAFLLGHREAANRCRIVDYLLYDDIDPQGALDTGDRPASTDGTSENSGISVQGERCGVVVADVHTHSRRLRSERLLTRRIPSSPARAISR